METDAEKLLTHCCGLNYHLEGEEVKLKADEEYPDWLWELDVKRPRPTSYELEEGTLEYFLALREEQMKRNNQIARKSKKKRH